MSKDQPVFGDLFKADGYLNILSRTEFPAVVAVKASRILRALKPDREPMMEAYRKVVVSCGTEVQPGSFQLKTAAQQAAAAKELDPLFEQLLSVEIKERLTLDEISQAQTPLAAEMLDVLWFLIDLGVD